MASQGVFCTCMMGAVVWSSTLKVQICGEICHGTDLILYAGKMICFV